MTSTSIHLWDAARPDDEDNTFPVYIYTDVIPRVGDEVCYWVDYPIHMPDRVRAAPREPEKITGIVARVRIDYRIMRGWGDHGDRKVVPMVSVYLDDYAATSFPDAAYVAEE